jgi:hypothetical protein
VKKTFLAAGKNTNFWQSYSSASPATAVMTAEVVSNLLSHSEVFWWGDRFAIEAEVTSTVAAAGNNLETILRELKAPRAGCAAKAAVAGGQK